MNTAEQIVEAYFRLCKGCFTYPDLKVPNGNNRQIDLLAVNLVSGEKFHVETGVTHELGWNKDIEGLAARFQRKFLGAPKERSGEKTDHAKGKNYFAQILAAYRSVGIDPDEIQRVWVCWVVKGNGDHRRSLDDYAKRHSMKRSIVVLSMRDRVLPELQDAVARSNYDDQVLRTLSLLKQMEVQRTTPSQPLKPTGTPARSARPRARN
jgi:hypothetical protein